MATSKIEKYAGQTSSIVSAISTGITMADGDPDVEMPRIISQSGLSREIGRLIMDRLFPCVDEGEGEIDWDLPLRQLLGELVWSPDAKKTFHDEATKQELYNALYQSSRGTGKTKMGYRIVSLSRRMSPEEISTFFDQDKTYLRHPSFEEMLQVWRYRRTPGYTGSRKTITITGYIHWQCAFVDESATFGFHQWNEELPVGTEVMLKIPSLASASDNEGQAVGGVGKKVSELEIGEIALVRSTALHDEGTTIDPNAPTSTNWEWNTYDVGIKRFDSVWFEITHGGHLAHPKTVYLLPSEE